MISFPEKKIIHMKLHMSLARDEDLKKSSLFLQVTQVTYPYIWDMRGNVRQMTHFYFEIELFQGDSRSGVKILTVLFDLVSFFFYII